MIYRHKVTGAIIDSPCVISGGQWVIDGETTGEDIAGAGLDDNTGLGEGAESKSKSDEGSIPESIDTNIGVNLDDITKKDIMQELDALGIKYNPKDNKATLYALLG